MLPLVPVIFRVAPSAVRAVPLVSVAKGYRNIQNKKGSLGTFVVQVSYRQKATWQGRVIYSEENEQYDFSSAKALVELMDQKVHEGR